MSYHPNFLTNMNSLDNFSLTLDELLSLNLPQKVICFHRNFWDLNEQLYILLNANKRTTLCKEFLDICSKKCLVDLTSYRVCNHNLVLDFDQKDMKNLLCDGLQKDYWYPLGMEDYSGPVGWRGPIVTVETFEANFDAILNLILIQID